MLDKGSSYLDHIFANMSLLNLVVISARIEYLHKKKKGGKEAQKRKTNIDDLITDEVGTYSFFPLCGASARRRRKDQARDCKKREFVGLPDRPSSRLSGRTL